MGRNDHTAEGEGVDGEEIMMTIEETQKAIEERGDQAVAGELINELFGKILDLLDEISAENPAYRHPMVIVPLAVGLTTILVTGVVERDLWEETWKEVHTMLDGSLKIMQEEPEQGAPAGSDQEPDEFAAAVGPSNG